MSNKIIIKNGAGAPPANMLSVAEFGFDTTNKKVYIGDTDGPIEVGIKGVAIDLQGATGTGIVKSQNPLKFEEQSFYPLTTVDQIIMADGSRLKEAGLSLGLVKSGGDVTISDGIISVNNAATADKLSIARTISLTGDVSGSGSFDGSNNLSITTEVGNDTHTHSFLARRGSDNTITSITADTTSGWGAYSTSVHWYSQLGQLTDQPSQYGYVANIGYGVEVQQLWFSAPGGGIYYRGGNGAGWSRTWTRMWMAGDAVTGAVWNDYAECRESDCNEPGYVLSENGDDTLSKANERLAPFAGVSSDTWGFSQGETDKAKTHIAVAGRVLVYPYKNREEYKPGDCVCAAPGGTVDIMTREEVVEWPDRIVGTVSCVPEYEEWGGGEGADREPVKVNGRIWIKVK